MTETPEKRAPLPMPAWAWLFVAGCLAIIVPTFPGLVPALIALGGAVGVWRVARDPGHSAGTRVGLSAAVLVLAWVVLWVWAVIAVVLLHSAAG